MQIEEKRGKVVVRVLFFRTSSTRPKPPTPRVSMMLKSAKLRLKKKAFSASYLWCQEPTQEEGVAERRENMGTGLEMR